MISDRDRGLDPGSADASRLALLNILEDFSADKELMDNSQKAVLNILEDVSADKELMEQTQKAMLNILDDSMEEKSLLEDMQKAVVNILDDYAGEIQRVEKMNQQLAEARDTLEARVGERTAELKTSNEELESFSYSVSHDLRAPLRAIAGYSQILVEDYADKLDEDGRKVIGTITRNARKMAALIDDILEFSRLGRQEMTLRSIPMGELFQSVFDELIQNEAGGAVEFVLGDLPPAEGDVGMIGQLVANLLSNAIKYGALAATRRIEVGCEPSPHGPAYFVRDNGVGFNMKYQDKLFGVFQRLHGENEFAGTGVGLAIAHRVVTYHRGKIWAESAPGQGATFHFTLGPADTEVAT